jgi:hypothetical protein
MITVAEGLCVSALFVRPAMASACYVLAHGAGACMTHADHSFHVPARTGRKDGDVRAELLNALTGWTRDVLLKGPTRDGQLISERRV